MLAVVAKRLGALLAAIGMLAILAGIEFARAALGCTRLAIEEHAFHAKEKSIAFKTLHSYDREKG